MRKQWLVVAAVAVIGGCSPIRPTVVDISMRDPTPGHYPVSVERGKWVGLNGVAIGIYVDRRVVATLGGGEAVTLYVPEGRHTIGVGPNGSNPAAAVPEQEIAVDVSPTSRPILRTNVAAAGWGGWKIERVAQ